MCMKQLTQRWFIFFIAIFFSISVQADDRFYIAPSLSYVMADSEREVDNAVGMRFGLGKPLTDSLNFEFSMSGVTFKGDDNELQQGGMGIDVLYYFHRGEEGSRSFYVVFGGGTLRSQEDANQVTNTTLNLGVGGVYDFSAKVKFRVDLRYRLENATSGFEATSKDDFVINLGLVVPVGIKQN